MPQLVSMYKKRSFTCGTVKNSFDGLDRLLVGLVVGVSLDIADGTAALILAAAGKPAVMDEVTSGLLLVHRSGHYQHFLLIALFIRMPLVSQEALNDTRPRRERICK